MDLLNKTQKNIIIPKAEDVEESSLAKSQDKPKSTIRLPGQIRAPAALVPQKKAPVIPKLESALNVFSEKGGVLGGGTAVKRPFPYTYAGAKGAGAVMGFGYVAISVGIEYESYRGRCSCLQDQAVIYIADSEADQTTVDYVTPLIPHLADIYIDIEVIFEHSDNQKTITPYLQLLSQFVEARLVKPGVKVFIYVVAEEVFTGFSFTAALAAAMFSLPADLHYLGFVTAENSLNAWGEIPMDQVMDCANVSRQARLPLVVVTDGVSQLQEQLINQGMSVGNLLHLIQGGDKGLSEIYLTRSPLEMLCLNLRELALTMSLGMGRQAQPQPQQQLQQQPPAKQQQQQQQQVQVSPPIPFSLSNGPPPMNRREEFKRPEGGQAMGLSSLLDPPPQEPQKTVKQVLEAARQRSPFDEEVKESLSRSQRPGANKPAWLLEEEAWDAREAAREKQLLSSQKQDFKPPQKDSDKVGPKQGVLGGIPMDAYTAYIEQLRSDGTALEIKTGAYFDGNVLLQECFDAALVSKDWATFYDIINSEKTLMVEVHKKLQFIFRGCRQDGDQSYVLAIPGQPSVASQLNSAIRTVYSDMWSNKSRWTMFADVQNQAGFALGFRQLQNSQRSSAWEALSKYFLTLDMTRSMVDLGGRGVMVYAWASQVPSLNAVLDYCEAWKCGLPVGFLPYVRTNASHAAAESRGKSKSKQQLQKSESVAYHFGGPSSSQPSGYETNQKAGYGPGVPLGHQGRTDHKSFSGYSTHQPQYGEDPNRGRDQEQKHKSQVRFDLPDYRW